MTSGILVKLYDVSNSTEAAAVNRSTVMNFDFDRSGSVHDLKKQIVSLDTISNKAIDRIQLSYNGSILPDNSSLKDIPGNAMLFGIIGSAYKSTLPVKTPKAVTEIDVMRLFNGLRLCLQDRSKRRKLQMALMDRTTTKSLIGNVPELSTCPEAMGVLKFPSLLYRLASVPDEFHKVVTKFPVFGEALSRILTQVAESNEETPIGMFSDPVVSLVGGLGLLDDDDDAMEAMEQARRQQLQRQQALARQQALERQQAQARQIPPSGPSTSTVPTTVPPSAPPVTPQMLSSALSAVLLGLAQQQTGGASPSTANAAPQRPPVAPAPAQAPPAPAVAPQQRFAAEIATLRSMGVDNDALALAALEATNGNIEAAIEFIFSSME